MDIWCREKRVYKKKNIVKEPRIRWWKLTGENDKVFIRKVIGTGMWNMEENLNEMWEKVAEGVKKVAKEVVGVSRGNKPQDKQTWWWAEEVQEIISKKKIQFKKWQKNREREDWVEYKSLSKAAKSAVSKAKLKKYDELYERLGTKEGGKEVYRLAKEREKQSRDFRNVWCIKDEDRRVLTEEKEVIKRWKDYC